MASVTGPNRADTVTRAITSAGVSGTTTDNADEVRVGNGIDLVRAGDGNDVLFGENGDDRLFRINFDPQGVHWEAARDCEGEVSFKYFGNTVEQMTEEYGHYDDASVFVTVTNSRDTVVAAARLITPGPAGLKTLNDVARAPWYIDGSAAATAAGIDLSATWDIATVSVRRRYSTVQSQLSAALYHGLFLAIRANELKATVAIVDAVVNGMLESAGIVFTPLPGAVAAPYLGSAASTPVYGLVEEQIKTLRRLRPDSHRLITTGAGVLGVAVPPLHDFRLRRL